MKLPCILLLALPATTLLGPILNGGFETGDLSGWSVTPVFDGDVTSAEAHSGEFSLQMKAVDFASQSLVRRWKTSDMDVMVVDLTNRCFLSCNSCTRNVMHVTETRVMTPETFRSTLDSLHKWWQPGRIIGLIGGEPTMAKSFAEIARIFRDEFNPGALTIGRTPIADMNKYAYERLYDRTNGKGLWTSFGPKFGMDSTGVSA